MFWECSFSFFDRQPLLPIPSSDNAGKVVRQLLLLENLMEQVMVMEICFSYIDAAAVVDVLAAAAVVAVVVVVLVLGVVIVAAALLLLLMILPQLSLLGAVLNLWFQLSMHMVYARSAARATATQRQRRLQQ